MRRTITYLLMTGVMVITMFLASGCGRYVHRSVALRPWDRNVTVSKRSKPHKIKRHYSPSHNRTANRAVKIPGR